ncbi:hypothetical protein L207DRAFT_529615 [Hyaloscypha variabilis F]|uniref:Uncharacterized protein n=1 Tax=Hyaloscypha variabilis (strain UAMH 11265 / GT02V1 / F) TaxID=1149755 RepID=A0A2J6RMB4_HYAVF|nr:hypothetical protein L207DRAFT_529615 [Hyaloscypha variabilis F]
MARWTMQIAGHAQHAIGDTDAYAKSEIWHSLEMQSDTPQNSRGVATRCHSPFSFDPALISFHRLSPRQQNFFSENFSSHHHEHHLSKNLGGIYSLCKGRRGCFSSTFVLSPDPHFTPHAVKFPILGKNQGEWCYLEAPRAHHELRGGTLVRKESAEKTQLVPVRARTRGPLDNWDYVGIYGRAPYYTGLSWAFIFFCGLIHCFFFKKVA